MSKIVKAKPLQAGFGCKLSPSSAPRNLWLQRINLPPFASWKTVAVLFGGTEKSSALAEPPKSCYCVSVQWQMPFACLRFASINSHILLVQIYVLPAEILQFYTSASGGHGDYRRAIGHQPF